MLGTFAVGALVVRDRGRAVAADMTNKVTSVTGTGVGASSTGITSQESTAGLSLTARESTFVREHPGEVGSETQGKERVHD